MPIRSLARLTLAAGLIAAATAAYAFPTDDQFIAVNGTDKPITELGNKIMQATGAEKDQPTLLSGCLAGDVLVFEVFFEEESHIMELAELHQVMKDPTDKGTLEKLFAEDLPKLKGLATAIMGLRTGHSAACKALPFLTVNGAGYAAAEKAAVQIIGLLSL